MLRIMSLDLKFLLARGINRSMNNLKKLTSKELRKIWLATFNSPAPNGYTKSYLIKELIWYEKYGNLAKNVQAKLDKLIFEYEKTKSVNIKKIKKFGVTSGTKFIREYKGEKYEVAAIDGGFRYKNQTYKTLSAVANIITGTHWNGKKFFGVANG